MRFQLYPLRFNRKGAAPVAAQLFPDFVQALRDKGLNVKTGAFGAHMDIDLNLNGPVNIVL
jgi:D-tyrosyl-tRNA(Tyr) deacylase